MVDLITYFLKSVTPGAQAAYGTPNELRRNSPLRRSNGEEVPFAGHTLELVSTAILKLES